MREVVEFLETLFCMLVKLVIINALSHQCGLIIIKNEKDVRDLLLTLLWSRLKS